MRASPLHCLLALLLMSAIVPVRAVADDGSVEVRSASSELVNGVHIATARLQYSLSDRISDALANGLALQINLSFEIDRQRRFWLDSQVANLSNRHVLRYNTVSERYTLRNENTGQQTSYATIFAALNTLGRIDGLPLVDQSLLDSGSRYRVRMRAVVSIADYPVSLRYLLFWRNDWRVTSDWYAWTLAP